MMKRIDAVKEMIRHLDAIAIALEKAIEDTSRYLGDRKLISCLENSRTNIDLVKRRLNELEDIYSWLDAEVL